jgi:hypothetical protein
MFYGQCWKCGERWELGTASTCKCPEELDASNYRLDPPGLDPLYTFTPSEPIIAAFNMKPNHNMTFHNQDGKHVGTLDFNGPEMTFTGDMDESAKVFFEFIANAFRARLEQERADEREACAKMCEEVGEESDSFTRDILRSTAAAIRARGNT